MDKVQVIRATAGYARPSRVAAAALALLCVCAAPRAWPMDGARIVVGATTAVDWTTGTCITTPDGADFQELMANGHPPGHPAWPHDGRSIVQTRHDRPSTVGRVGSVVAHRGVGRSTRAASVGETLPPRP